MNALKTGNKQGINLTLRAFKLHNGVINFPALFEIRSESRLPYLAQNSINDILPLIATALTLAFETMNLARPMTNAQVLDLAETILESSNEDNLALEDLMLFLQKLTRGEYGKLYESMDIPKFMQFFEMYREERYQALKALRDEQDAQNKALGSSQPTTPNDVITDKMEMEVKNDYAEILKSYLRDKRT
jgi:hypothetical protein